MWDAVHLQSRPCGLAIGCGLTRGTGQPTRAQPMRIFFFFFSTSYYRFVFLARAS